MTKKRKAIALEIAGLITLISAIPMTFLMIRTLKESICYVGILLIVTAILQVVGIRLLAYAEQVNLQIRVN
jgi:hypothetical protein